MITFKRYRRFLSELSTNKIYSFSINTLIEHKSSNKLFVKHDVEANLHLALRTAQIEAEFGHSATYYFQGALLLQDGADDIIKEVHKLGHEVAYHYDVLDSCNGDYATAIAEFDRYKSVIEEISGQPIKSVCPHGNPIKSRNGWKSNKDFFRSDMIRQRYPNLADIVVDFGRLLPRGLYISDAGFKLRKIGNISGNDTSNEAAITDGTPIDLFDILKVVTKNQGVVLSIHTHRLRDSEFSLSLLRARTQILRSGYLLLKYIPFVKAFVSQFYSLTRYL